MKTNKNSRGRKTGFTLVELLAVIVILAIILVIAVPKVMSVIEDAKKATLESTAKMIASQAEKQKVQNTVLGNDEAITCKDITNINDVDYASCDITFENNTAQVTIEGSGKFEGLYVCNGTKTEAIATEEECVLICKKDEIEVVDSVVAVTPYEIKDYDSCVSYMNTTASNFGYSHVYLDRVCKEEVLEKYSFSQFIYDLLDVYTKEELISNNVVNSNIVWESNITLGNANSCVNYTKDVAIDDWGYSEEELELICSDVNELQWFINGLLWEKIFTPEELIQNNVVGSDSVFANIKPGNQTSCVNNLKDIVVDEWGYEEEELQNICKGEDIIQYTTAQFIEENIDYIFKEQELIENNVIKAKITKKCVLPGVLAIQNLHNSASGENGLIKDNTDDKNLRYVGSNDVVKNYVEFGNTGELWRIIGIFEVKTSSGKIEKLLKLVRNDTIGKLAWDSSVDTVNSGYGVNEWSQADLKTMLNTYYLGTTNICTNTCKDPWPAQCFTNCALIVKPINSTYKNMIENVVWNTGAIVGTDVTILNRESDILNTLNWYNAERGEATGRALCSNNLYNCSDSYMRTTEWEGLVALPYVSDWGYASSESVCSTNLWDGFDSVNGDFTNGTCKKNNWMHYGMTDYLWMLSPFAETGYSNSVSAVYTTGRVVYHSTYRVFDVRPALYLKYNVYIIDGDGSEENPYKLS